MSEAKEEEGNMKNQIGKCFSVFLLIVMGCMAVQAETAGVSLQPMGSIPGVSVGIYCDKVCYPAETPVSLLLVLCNTGTVPVEVFAPEGLPYRIQWSLGEDVRQAMLVNPSVLQEVFGDRSKESSVVEKEVVKKELLVTIEPGSARVWPVRVLFGFRKEGAYVLLGTLPECEVRAGGKTEKKVVRASVTVRVEKSVDSQKEGMVRLISKDEGGKSLPAPVLQWTVKSKDGATFDGNDLKGEYRIQVLSESGKKLVDIPWSGQRGGQQGVPEPKESFQRSIPLTKDFFQGKFQLEAGKANTVLIRYRDFLPTNGAARSLKAGENCFLLETDLSKASAPMPAADSRVLPIQKVGPEAGEWISLESRVEWP